MDQFASCFGKAGYLIRLNCKTLDYQYFPFSCEGYKLVLLDTCVKHELASSAYNKRRESCENAAFRWPEDHIVAKDGDRVIGYAAYGAQEDAPGTGEVFGLYVLSEYHGTGVGRRLMQAALEQLKAYPVICLWTLKENRRAIRFYEKCGFAADGQEQVNTRINAEEIRMVLTDRSVLL